MNQEINNLSQLFIKHKIINHTVQQECLDHHLYFHTFNQTVYLMTWQRYN